MLNDGALTITDPVPGDVKTDGLIAKIFRPYLKLGSGADLPFVRLALLLTVVFVPLAVALFVEFHWWLALPYLALYGYFLGPFVLMLHNTSHRFLFKNKYKLANKYIPWVIGSLLGQTPETYYAHHLGMHHVDGNLPDDLSCTMKYRRDSFIHFLRYWARFFFLGDYELCAYFAKRKRWQMLRRFIIGEASWFAVAIALSFVSWQAAVVVFWFPMFMTRFMLMTGNWGQHAFVDPDDPTNDYRTVITFINSNYNHKCFNDGYHLGHHLKSGRHWLDMPADFLSKRERMVQENSLVFRKLDYFLIFILLMFKRHRFLARFYVNLDPDNPKTEDEIVALLKHRLQPLPAHQLETLRRHVDKPAAAVAAG